MKDANEAAFDAETLAIDELARQTKEARSKLSMPQENPQQIAVNHMVLEGWWREVNLRAQLIAAHQAMGDR